MSNGDVNGFHLLRRATLFPMCLPCIEQLGVCAVCVVMV